MEKKTIFVFKGIVFNKKHQVLIDNRKEKKLESADGKWELPGGKIEFGESPEETVGNRCTLCQPQPRERYCPADR